jgi:hypothetical protein
MPIGVARSNKTRKLDTNNTVKPVKVLKSPVIEIKQATSSDNFPDVYLTPQNIIGGRVILTSPTQGVYTNTIIATAGYRLDSNGQAQKFNGIEWVTIENQWLNRGNASDYEVRVTYSKFESKGSYTFSGKIGTWIDLSAPREWISYASGDNSLLSVGFNVEIRNISTKIVVATIPLTLTAHT